MLKHTFIYALARIFPGLINFFAIIIYTRLLMPSEYGLYAIIISIVTFLEIIFFKWLNISVIRFRKVYEHNETKFISSVIGSYVILAIISILLVPFMFLLLAPKYHTFVLLSLFYFLSQSWSNLNMELVRSNLKPTLYSIMYLVKAFISVVLSILLLKLGFGIHALLLGLSIANLLSSLINFKEWLDFNFRYIDISIIKETLSYGLPLTLSAGLVVIIDSSDRLLLGILDSTASVGIYSVSYDLIQRTIGVLLVIINTSSLPLVIKYYEKKDIHNLNNTLRYTITLLLLIGMPAFVGLSMIAEELSIVLLGKQFVSQSKWLMPIIGLAILFSCIKSYYFNLPFHLKKATHIQLKISLIGAVSNIILNIILIPFSGALGAAFATLLTFFLVMILSWYLGRRKFILPIPLMDLMKITISTLIMFVFLSIFQTAPTKTHIILTITISALIYFITVIILNVGNSKIKVKLLFINTKNKFLK